MGDGARGVRIRFRVDDDGGLAIDLKGPRLRSGMMAIKAVGFDLFGTLVEAEADWRTGVLSMCRHLRGCGYAFSDDAFVSNYQAVVAEYRRIRYEELREVNNGVWVADTLRRMGLEAQPSSPHIISAVERYFDAWKITVAPDAPGVLERLRGRFTLALVSNFTDGSFLRRLLGRLGIGAYFDHIIDSDSVGWRKPHPAIFQRFLELSGARAEEAVFIGDDLDSDIKGAQGVGIRAVLLDRSRPARDHQGEGEVQPDHSVSSLEEFELLLSNEREHDVDRLKW